MRTFYLLAAVVSLIIFVLASYDEKSSIGELSASLVDAAVDGSANILVNTVKNVEQAELVDDVELQHQPQSMRELQQQYDDYYALALELLHRARAGDGESQFALANLLVFCQINSMVDNFELVDNVRKDIDILLTQDISPAEMAMLSTTMSELEKCDGFRNTDLKFFDDNNYTNEQMAERTGYWVKKAFENGVADAAAYLLSMHDAKVITLTSTEFTKVAAMTKTQLAQPTFVTMMSLLQWSSSEHFAKVAWVLAQENGFYKEYDGLVFDGNVAVINCIKASVFSSDQAAPDYDCAENVARYGMWVQPELIPEIEAEVEEVKKAWKKGDYAAAGFEALMPLLNDTHQP